MPYGAAQRIILKSVNLEQKYIQKDIQHIYIYIHKYIHTYREISIDISSVGLVSAHPSDGIIQKQVQQGGVKRTSLL